MSDELAFITEIYNFDVEGDNNEILNNQENSLIVDYEIINDEAMEFIFDKNISAAELEENLKRFDKTAIIENKRLSSYKKHIDKYLVLENGSELNEIEGLKLGGNKKNAKILQMKCVHLNNKNLKNVYKIKNSSIKLGENDEWFVVSLDVGRGDSTLIITPTKKMYLYDCGDRNKKVYLKVKKYFKKFGVDELSGIFISHPDNDHFGGLRDVLDEVNLSNDCFIYYNYKYNSGGKRWASCLEKITDCIDEGRLRLLEMPKNSRKPLLNIMSGLPASFYWPNTLLNFNRSGKGSISKNDSSHCIFVGNSGRYLMNLCGDIEDSAWEHLLQNKKIESKIIKDTFLFKYPHHGRKTGNPEINSLYASSYFESVSICDRIVSTDRLGKHFCKEICDVCHPFRRDRIYCFKGEKLICRGGKWKDCQCSRFAEELY